MKKFLLSLCVLAVASVCVFMTSCKDSDEFNTHINNNVKSEIAAAQDADYTYTYVLNGQTYNSLDALNKAIDELPAGSEGNTIYVVATPTDGGPAKTGKTSTFATPKPGEKAVVVSVEVPGDTNKTAEVTLNTTVESQHSGGAIK